MKVFIATHGEYDSYRIIGVFSTREAYEEFINQSCLEALKTEHPNAVCQNADGTHLNCPPRLHDFHVEEFEIDTLQPITWEWVTFSQAYPGEKLPCNYPKEFLRAKK